jgi:hypothetical protein
MIHNHEEAAARQKKLNIPGKGELVLGGFSVEQDGADRTHALAPRDASDVQCAVFVICLGGGAHVWRCGHQVNCGISAVHRRWWVTSSVFWFGPSPPA